MNYKLKFEVTNTVYQATLSAKQQSIKEWTVTLVTNNTAEIFARLIEELVVVKQELLGPDDQIDSVEFYLFKHWLALNQQGALLAANFYGKPAATKYLSALKMNGIGGQLERKDGIEFDDLTPLILTLQYKNEQPTLWAQSAQYVSLTGYFAQKLLKQTMIRRDEAKWTGFYNQATGAWDRQALAVSGLQAEQLPVITDAPLIGSVDADFAKEYGLNPAMEIKVILN